MEMPPMQTDRPIIKRPLEDTMNATSKRLGLAVWSISIIMLFVTGCNSPADQASHNLSAAADNFEVQRRIIFFNGITDTYLLTIEGRCSLGNNDTALRMSVTCKVGDDEYKKHFLGLSDNVSFFVEQLEGIDINEYRYKVYFRPASILPDVEVQTP